MARNAAVPLGAAWVAAGIAYFEPVNPAWLAVLGVLASLTVAAVWAGAGQAPPSALLVPGLAAVSIMSLLIWPPTAFVATDAHLAPAMVAAFSAPAAVLFLPLVHGRAARASIVAVLALLGVGYALVIWGGTPVIDVWVLLQDSARGLLHGANPYQMTFPGVPRGQDSTCFTYWPGTFLATAPANWVLGDVRWAEAGYLLSAVTLTAWSAGRCSGWQEPRRPALAGLALAAATGVVPATALVVLQAWTEPILLLGLVGAAVLIDRHPNWAVLPLGLALASKQYMLIMVPLLAFWPRFGWRRVLATAAVATMIALPWLLLSLQRFQQCTISYFLHEPTPLTSLSLWRYLPAPMRLPLTIAATALAAYVAIRRCPRNGAGFLLAAGATLIMFNAVNKETFPNQWWLAAALITASFALQHPSSASTGKAGVPNIPSGTWLRRQPDRQTASRTAGTEFSFRPCRFSSSLSRRSALTWVRIRLFSSICPRVFSSICHFPQRRSAPARCQRPNEDVLARPWLSHRVIPAEPEAVAGFPCGWARGPGALLLASGVSGILPCSWYGYCGPGAAWPGRPGRCGLARPALGAILAASPADGRVAPERP